jgi:alkaline phosphatase D
MSRKTWTDAEFFSTNRRGFLLSGASIAILPFAHKVTLGYVNRRNVLASDPFQLGVASGDPVATGVVLWTRLALNPLQENGGMPSENFEVRWEIAADEGVKSIVQKGTSIATPQLGHSIHVEVAGLEPDRWYWYRFHCGDATSPVGRTRTMPAIDSSPKELQFAFASCQHFETGLYTAYQHMSRDSLDLIVHLGDYIYEGAGQDKRVRKHVGMELMSLENYRTRYAQYKSDIHLQSAHASAPWLVTWDDHEFDNNYANLVSEESNVDPQSFLLRRAAAYQAYYENMPLRASSIPKGHDMQLYRRLHFGRLAQFEMLDTRQYRTDQPNGDGSKPIVGDALSPKGTLLGPVQEKWLTEGLLGSDAQWNILAQQVMMARVDRAPGEDKRFSMDQWSGYDVARTRLLELLAARNKKNTVVLTGDIHNNWANDLKVNFDDTKSPTVATEFVGTSISSGGNGTAKPKGLDSLYAENPFVKFHNAERGYVRCTVTHQEWKTDFQVVEYVDQPGAPNIKRASFVVERDRPGALPV